MATIHKLTKDGATIFPATITDAVVHPQTGKTLTSMMKDYNVSELFPTEGIDGGNKYNLALAIQVLGTHLSAAQKTGGIKLTFISSVSPYPEEEYYLGKSSWSGNASDWDQRFEVGDVVADPSGSWEPSTAQAYIDSQVATLNTGLASEAIARQNGDRNLQTQLQSEMNTRAGQDANLNALINAGIREGGGVQFDIVPTQNSANGITSGGIYNTLRDSGVGFVDEVLIAGSDNLVKSKGINRALFLQDTQTHYYILTEADNPGSSMLGGIKNLNICIKSGDKIYLHLKINSLAGGTSGAVGSIHLGDYTTENRLADFYFGYGDTTFERTVEITSQYDIDDLQMWFSNEPQYTSYELDFDVKSDAGVEFDQVIAELNRNIDSRVLASNVESFEYKSLSEPYKYYDTSLCAKAGDVIYFNASLTAVSGSGAISCVLAGGDNNTIDTLYLNVGISRTLKITLQDDVSNAKVMFRNEAGLTSPAVSYVISKKPILDHLNIHVEGTSEVQSYIFRIGASKSKEFAYIIKNFTRTGGSSVAINMYGNNGSLLKDAYGDGVYEITTNDGIEYVTLNIYPNGTTSYSADVYVLTPELYYVYKTLTQLDVWLPNNIYALKGTTLQLFTCALAPVLNPSNYNLCIEKVDSTDCGVNRGFCYQYEVQNNKSDYRLRFGLQDDHVSHMQEGNTKIVHVSKKSSPASNKNILCIGDSFTDADYWVSELRRLLTGVVTDGYSDSVDSPVTADSLTNLTFIGTKDTNLTPNEGYSGWGYRNFATGSDGNPFWYNEDVNFTQYCHAHGYSKIDYAIILLGTNYGYEESYVKKVWDALVTHNSSIKVIVAGGCFANPYGAGANGMLYNQTYMQLSYGVHLINKQFQALAESNNYKNNFLYVDYNVLCDNFNNMDFFMMDANIRNIEVKVRSSLRPIDNVHPGKKMYWQMADAFRAAVHYWFLG